MPASLQTKPERWQGLGIRLSDSRRDELLCDTASWVAGELLAVGGDVPVAVLIAVLERHNYDRPDDLLVDALTDAPGVFTFYAL
jgi:hypothetical protein